ncbi:MAG: SAM-dependent methyltransferase [Bacteroidetes bacterium]|nr:SAM-dependent methyltransferase [Bacteroidota bacterium]
METALYLLPNRLSESGQSPWLDHQGLRELVTGLDGLFIESERGAGRFLHALGVSRHIRNYPVWFLPDLLKPDRLQQAIASVKQGERWGVVSDAGYPGVADPGAEIVRMAHIQSWKVVPFPGPSSIILSLAATGLNGQRFLFQGYLTRKSTDRIPVLQALERESAARNLTQIFIEAPHRNQDMLSDCLRGLQPETWLGIATDLTGQNESIRSRQIHDWKKAQWKADDSLPAIFLIQARPES